MNLLLNISDHIVFLRDKATPDGYFTRLESYTKIYEECSKVLSEKIVNGQLDATKEHSLFLCTKYGAVAVTIIPNRMFQ